MAVAEEDLLDARGDVSPRDSSGDLILDSPRAIHLLEDEDGEETFPAGI